MSWDDDQPPYSMIGYQSTLPGRHRTITKRPIGFIWPKEQKKQASKPKKRKA